MSTSPDRTVNIALAADLTVNRLITSDGSTFNFPLITEADTLVCTLRTYQRTDAGDLKEIDLPVRTLRASIGKVYTPPTGGTFKLRRTVDGVPTDSDQIAFNATPEAFAAALAPILPAAVAECSRPADSTWLFRLSTGAEFELGPGGNNRLDPSGLPRVRIWERYTGEYWCEVRLIQTPLAWNDGHERVLAPPPSVREIRAGSPGSDSQPPVNELQALTLPLAFRGTYFLRWNYRVTRVLGVDDGPDEIADALNKLFDDGAQRFSVTNPEDQNAYIEFIGALAGQPQPEIDVDVNTFAPGVLTFALPLDEGPLGDALRTAPKIDSTFEIELELGDPEHPEVAGRMLTICRQTITIEREEIWHELDTVRRIDWLRPGQPVNYIPFTPDQIITGQQSYTAVFGNGVSKVHSFPHNLGTFNLSGLIVRENIAGGRVLSINTEFRATSPSENELVLAFPDPVAADALVVILTTAGPKSAFQAHTHTMEQIIGLLDKIAQIEGRLDNLEDLLPTATLARVDNNNPQTIELPEVYALYPGRVPSDMDLKELKAEDVESLRPAGLLPAIHDATVTEVTAMPGTLAAGEVYKNTGTAPIQIVGAGGRKSADVMPGEYFGFDGRFPYRVTRAGDSNSFFPTDMERDLFLVPVTAAMWRAGQRLEVTFEIDLQLVAANTRGQIVVNIAAGTVVSQATPSPTSTNVEKIQWADKPILSQVCYLSDLQMPHTFGALIKRAVDNTLSAEALAYTAWTAAPAESLPSSPGLMLRGYLSNFDTENAVTGAVGFVHFAFTNGKFGIS